MVRFYEPTFTEMANIINALFTYQIPKAIIREQQQCFAEGCLSIYNFHVSSINPPKMSLLKPLEPNILQLNIIFFDLEVISSVSGSIQIFINIPVAGNFLVRAKQLSIIASLDLQKDEHRNPYIRLVSCDMIEGFIDAKFIEMGLVTDAINIKYKEEIITKTRITLHNAICENLDRMIQNSVNTKFLKFSKAISMFEIAQFFKNEEIEISKQRSKRYVGKAEIKEITDNMILHEKHKLHTLLSDQRLLDQPRGLTFTKDLKLLNNLTTTQNLYSLFNLFHLDSLKTLFLHLDIIDSKSGNGFYSVDIDGSIFMKNNSVVTYGDVKNRSEDISFPSYIRKSPLNIVVLDSVPNSLLQQAHRSKILRLYVNKNTPIFGDLLKTTCSVDEVCLIDSIPEAGEQYPSTRFDVIIETVRPPKIDISESMVTFFGSLNLGNMKLNIIGIATFILEQTRQEVGKMPFISTITVWVNSKDGDVKATISMTDLEILEDVEFFELPNTSLNGFRDSIKGAFNNLISQFTDSFGSMISSKLKKYGISQVSLEFLNEGLILLQSKFDPYNLLIDDGFENFENV